MSRTPINTGSAINAGDSDSIRGGLIASEDNFVELYNTNLPPLFPATSSVSNPTQIKSSIGDTILGVTGSIEAINVSSSFGIQINDVATGFSPLLGGISYEYQANYIGLLKFSNYNNYLNFKAKTSDDDQVGQFLVGKVSFTDRVRFNGHSNNQEWYIKGSTNPYLLNGTGDNNAIGIKINSQLTSNKDLQVNSSISSSDYFSTNFPTSDPEVEGQFFVTSSLEVMGRFNFDILCVSQG
jgi:hypothetical protein